MRPVLLTNDYLKTQRARAVPGAEWDAGYGAWILPPDCDDHSARVALRLFPELMAEYPDLVERAAVQDIRPIDAATSWYAARPAPLTSGAQWPRVERNAATRGIAPHRYQNIDVAYSIDRLNKLGGAYLGWEPGLGKTLGACMVMDGWDCNFVLIACPNSVKADPWLKDLPVYCPWLEPVVIGNSAKDRRAKFKYAKERMDAGEPTAVICHYEALALVGRMDRKAGTTWDKLGKFDLRIADEAHRLKNEKTAFTRAFRKIKAVGTLLLSGTCTDGEFEELFVPMQLMQPRRYTRRWDGGWNDKYGDYVDGDHGQLALGVKPHRLEELRTELSEVLVVRRAKDELDIPAPHVADISVEMRPEQRAVYDALLEDLFAELPDGEFVATTKGAGLVQALRTVTGGVPLPDGGFASAKLDRLVDRYADIGKQQAVVFAWHRELAERAAARLQGAGHSAEFVHGGTSDKRLEGLVRAFHAGDLRIVVATIKKLGIGVNLQEAERVSFLENSWEPRDNEQARDRVVRQGQTAHVLHENYTCTGTADELRVLPRLLTKQLLRQLLVGR
jgi:hypothetical protein